MKLDRLGLWWQCFRSFTVNKDIHHQRFFVGCRWIFDRFTTGYDDVREMLAERKSLAKTWNIQTVKILKSLMITEMFLRLQLSSYSFKSSSHCASYVRHLASSYP